MQMYIVGVARAGSSPRLRERPRQQIVNHDGEILHVISLLQQAADESGDELLSSLDDPAEQFNLMLRISRLEGVLGIRLFTPAGKFYTAFPAYITKRELPAQELASLRALKP